jgi:hypothetical protein
VPHPKNIARGIRGLLAGKICRFCGGKLATHMMPAGSEGGCRQFFEVHRESQRLCPTSGAAWLRTVKQCGRKAEAAA